MNRFFFRGDFFSKYIFNSTFVKITPARLKKAVLDLIYPENLYCACCKDCLDPKTRIYGLCDKCAGKFNWITENPFRLSMDEFSFDKLIACCIYGYYPRLLIHSLKLSGKRYLAKPIARLMAERFLSEDDPDNYDCISTIPSSKEKIEKRGFNQAELIAKEVSSLLDLPYMQLMEKPEEIGSMRLSNRNQRMALIEGAFKVHAKVPKRVLLIDDVLTTGATASEASRELKNAGAEMVCVLVFASSNGNRDYKQEQL